MNKYYTYILRCCDNTLYTGITTDIKRRMEEHKNKGKLGAKYTHRHDFLRLEIYFESDSRSIASKLEYRIKRLSKKEKESIITDKNLIILKDIIDIDNYICRGDDYE